MSEVQNTAFNEDALKSGKTLVAFKAAWCGPCKMMTPTLIEMAEEGYSIQIVDADESPEALVKYGVRSVPTLMMFEDGQSVVTTTGPKSKTALAAMFD